MNLCTKGVSGLRLLLKAQLSLAILVFGYFYGKSVRRGRCVCVCLQRSLMYRHRKSKRRDENSWGTGSRGRFSCYLEVSSFLSLLLFILCLSRTYSQMLGYCTVREHIGKWTYSRLKAHIGAHMNIISFVFAFRLCIYSTCILHILVALDLALDTCLKYKSTLRYFWLFCCSQNLTKSDLI